MPWLGVVREFFRYFLASFLALAVDMCALLLLSKYIHYAWAATASFMLGAVVHYAVSVLFVFQRRRLLAKKHLEASIFIASGGLSLLVNVGVISLSVEWLELSLFGAKLLAAGASFVLAYGIRKMALF